MVLSKGDNYRLNENILRTTQILYEKEYVFIQIS